MATGKLAAVRGGGGATLVRDTLQPINRRSPHYGGLYGDKFQPRGAEVGERSAGR